MSETKIQSTSSLSKYRLSSLTRNQCVGGVPCLHCQNTNTECVFNSDLDGRRRITLKRKIESLEQDRDLLMHLVDNIRNDNKSVLDLIRSNASLSDIRLHLSENLPQGHSDKIPKNQKFDHSSSHSSRRYMDIRRLSDIPIYEVPAKPWTTVTDDDALVSHLISLHFSCNQSGLNWIDRDLFLRDMSSGNLDCVFCSPLLVNSILGMACVSIPYHLHPNLFYSVEWSR